MLRGAEDISEFLFGTRTLRRRVYHLAETSKLPVFRLGSLLCARRSVLMDWIDARRGGLAHRRQPRRARQYQPCCRCRHARRNSTRSILRQAQDEDVWQFIRDNWLGDRIFASYEDILDQCCVAWNRLIEQPWKIMSIGLRDWAHRY